MEHLLDGTAGQFRQSLRVEDPANPNGNDLSKVVLDDDLKRAARIGREAHPDARSIRPGGKPFSGRPKIRRRA